MAARNNPAAHESWGPNRLSKEWPQEITQFLGGVPFSVRESTLDAVTDEPAAEDYVRLDINKIAADMRRYLERTEHKFEE